MNVVMAAMVYGALCASGLWLCFYFCIVRRSWQYRVRKAQWETAVERTMRKAIAANNVNGKK